MPQKPKFETEKWPLKQVQGDRALKAKRFILFTALGRNMGFARTDWA